MKKPPFLIGLIVLTFLFGCLGQPSPPKGEVDAIAVWQHYTKQDWDIWYSIWDDAREQWWTLNGTASPISTLKGNDYDPNIEFGPHDSAIAVWSNQETGDIYYSIWSLNNFTWTPAKPLCQIPGLDIDPDVAYNSKGEAVCVWVHVENGKRLMYYSTYNKLIGKWSQAKSLTPNYTLYTASLPEITYENEEKPSAIAIWSDSTSSNITKIFYSRFNGNKWCQPQPIPLQTRNAVSDFHTYTVFRCGISEHGSVKAVWSTENGEVMFSIWNGVSWTKPQTIGYMQMPETDCDSRDCAIVTYVNTENNGDVWSSYECGNFKSGFAANSGTTDYRPAVVFLQSGKALTVWWSTEKGGEIYYSVWRGNWSKAKRIVLNGLEGKDLNPEISSSRISPPPPTPSPTETFTPPPPLPPTVKPSPTSPTPQKQILTACESNFSVKDDVITVSVEFFKVIPLLPYSNKVYDLEIFFNEQKPKWKSAGVIEPIPGWGSERIPGGLRLYGKEALPVGKVLNFKLKIVAEKPNEIKEILIHVTGKNHTNYGYLISSKTVSPVKPKNKPDLKIEKIEAPPPKVQAPISTKATVKIKNEGNTSSPPTTVKFKLYWEEELVNEQELKLPDLDPGEEIITNFNFSLEAPGRYKIEVAVDPNNSVAESNETNNQDSVYFEAEKMKLPDLVVEHLRVNYALSEVFENLTLHNVQFEIVNSGEGEAEPPIYFQVLFDGEVLATNICPVPLPSMEKYFYTLKIEEQLPLGQHNVTVIVDPLNLISELNESNNQAQKLFPQTSIS